MLPQDNALLSIISTSKRDSITILADILRSLSNCKKARKMTIVYKSNLNFIRIRRYLDILVTTGMVEVTNDRDNILYNITERGREFLLNYERLKESLKMPGIAGKTSVLLT